MKINIVENMDIKEFKKVYKYVLANLYTDYADYVFNDYMLEKGLYNLELSFDEINVYEILEKVERLNLVEQNNTIKFEDIVLDNNLKNVIVFTVGMVENYLKILEKSVDKQ